MFYRLTSEDHEIADLEMKLRLDAQRRLDELRKTLDSVRLHNYSIQLNLDAENECLKFDVHTLTKKVKEMKDELNEMRRDKFLITSYYTRQRNESSQNQTFNVNLRGKTHRNLLIDTVDGSLVQNNSGVEDEIHPDVLENIKQKNKIIIADFKMATGGSCSRTLEGGHETFYDFSCSLCEKENKHVEAIKYCEECFVYLCDHCLTSHNKFPLNQRHKLLHQSQFAAVNKSALVSFPTNRCPKHPGELLNIFCGNHDVVCCSVCKALEHSSCVETQHLPDAAKGIQSSQELQNILTVTRTFVSDIDKALNDRKADLSRIAKEKLSVRKTIAVFRKKVNKYFDDLEKNSLAELEHREQIIVNHIDKEKKYLETTKSNADDILKQLESFKGDNECDLFVKVKAGLQFVTEEVDKIRVITEAEESPSIQFEINRNIEKYITSLTSLGSFSSTSIISSPPQKSAVPKVKISSVPVLPTQQQSDYNVQYSTYKTQKCEKFDIKEKSDTETCYIFSICQLPDGTFLITDANNKKLKRLDQSLKLLDSVKLSSAPHSVCAAGPSQAAVSYFKKIQLVSVGKKLSLTRLFTVGNYSRGIVFSGNELFVCCGDKNDSSSGCIEVYNIGGQLQRTISRDQLRLSSVPLHITASDDGQHLLVTSWDSDVITMLDLTGNVVNTFSHLKNLNGICTDGRGQVFVCGRYNHTVVQLSPKHQKIEVILKKEDGIIYPKGVCYDREQSRLIVSCFNKNELFSFT